MIPSVPRRDSSDIGYPVKNNLSEKGRKITYLALAEEYEHFFRLIVKAESLSKKDISNSLKDTKKIIRGWTIRCLLWDRNNTT